MSETPKSEFVCKQAGCNVLIDGKCLEGLELSKCSHIESSLHSKDKALSFPQEAIDETTENKTLYESTHLGESLEMDDCGMVMSDAVTKVVLLAGREESGKTTLLSSLFQMFQDKDSFAGYQFGGSLTLVGFEKICHESRITSERDEADTNRTPQGSPKFLHLKLNNSESNTDILFTDISGEDFEKLANSTDECEKFEIAKRIDHFALFMDSDLLSDQTHRHQLKINSLNLLRSLIDSKMIDKNVFIEIIFSRWDLLLGKPDKERHVEFINEIKEEVIKKFSTSHPRLKFFEIASRPNRESKLEFGYGVDKIIPTWVNDSPFSVEEFQINATLKPAFSSQREFSKFQFFTVQ